MNFLLTEVKPMLTAYMLTFVYNLYFTKPFSITQALRSDHLGLLKQA